MSSYNRNGAVTDILFFVTSCMLPFTVKLEPTNKNNKSQLNLDCNNKKLNQLGTEIWEVFLCFLTPDSWRSRESSRTESWTGAGTNTRGLG